MNKGECNVVHYTLPILQDNSNMASIVTMWLHHSYAQQGYTERAATSLSCVKIVSCFNRKMIKVNDKAWSSQAEKFLHDY